MPMKVISVTNDVEERKKLSFEQAEGAEPLPSQLQLREISPQLRALLWERVYHFLRSATEHSDYSWDYLDKPWWVSAIALPQALPLFVSALAALGFVALRQRSTAARLPGLADCPP